MLNPACSFRIPNSILQKDQVNFCLGIINKYRTELVPLRRQVLYKDRKESSLEKQINQWKEKYYQEKQKRKELEKENNNLIEEMEKMIKTNNRYRISLFDHGNFSHPDTKSKKKKGGQPGHKDTNREAFEDYQQYPQQRLFFKKCPQCHKSLSRVNSIRQKILLDIVVNPTIVKLLLQSERQWCSRCQKEVKARHQQSLPFTEYGINTFMVILLLRFRCLLSLKKIAMVLQISFGLNISKSGVKNLLKQSKIYLKSRYRKLTKLVQQGQIMYNDETGWLVRGKKAWLWIMANDKITVYKAAESRGKGIFEEMYGNSQASSMHDGYAAYKNTILENNTMYCWAHLLRFVHEETNEQKPRSAGVKIKNKLVKIYRLIEKRDEYTEQEFREIVDKKLNQILSHKSKESSVKAIQYRLREQKQGLINALLYSPDGTNNLAERELRNMVMGRRTSNGSDTFAGMEITAILGSVIQTLHRQSLPFFPSLQKYIQAGVKKIRPKHTYLSKNFFDDS